MPDRNYRRRLQALTGSPSYGPKYRKLTKTDQRQVDQLIRDNNGRAARVQLNLLDESRREAVRKRSARRRKVDKFDALPDEERTREAGLEINEDGDKAFWDMYKNRRAA
jgi:hypothetical protein